MARVFSSSHLFSIFGIIASNANPPRKPDLSQAKLTGSSWPLAIRSTHQAPRQVTYGPYHNLRSQSMSFLSYLFLTGNRNWIHLDHIIEPKASPLGHCSFTQSTSVYFWKRHTRRPTHRDGNCSSFQILKIPDYRCEGCDKIEGTLSISSKSISKWFEYWRRFGCTTQSLLRMMMSWWGPLCSFFILFLRLLCSICMVKNLDLFVFSMCIDQMVFFLVRCFLSKFEREGGLRRSPWTWFLLLLLFFFFSFLALVFFLNAKRTIEVFSFFVLSLWTSNPFLLKLLFSRDAFSKADLAQEMQSLRACTLTRLKTASYPEAGVN